MHLPAEERKTVSVTVKMTPTDLRKFIEGAAVIWPGALISRSNIILSLAHMGLQRSLSRKKK
jgi:hypothetical protein